MYGLCWFQSRIHDFEREGANFAYIEWAHINCCSKSNFLPNECSRDIIPKVLIYTTRLVKS